MKKPGWAKRKCLSQSRSYYRHTTVCSQNKPLLNLCFLSFLAQSPLDVIWSTIALRLTRLALRSPGWSLRYNLKLMLWLASSTWACKLLLVWSNVDNVNIDWAHWLGPPFSLSLAISLSPPSLLRSLSLSVRVWSYCMLNVQALESIHRRLWLLYDNLSTRFYSCPTQGEVNPSRRNLLWIDLNCN